MDSEIFRANAAMERFIANDIHHFIFQLGINAKNRSDFEDTKSLFKKELARAKESSVTQRDIALYAGELNRLNSMTQKGVNEKS
ncbi:hypothetical protein H8K52_18290 [Undibacterium seohonense]|uniref:Uncharacterized protein n=1 Tax=Undibacterium seohonense TaxID=1344950 RepID=A0ABR6X991_9BURK|nr:hypothetical protein [Undibacterium seohonense]MBC3809293.1 hypothetical protein [Undibacterium seohonense]